MPTGVCWQTRGAGRPAPPTKRTPDAASSAGSPEPSLCCEQKGDLRAILHPSSNNPNTDTLLPPPADDARAALVQLVQALSDDEAVALWDLLRSICGLHALAHARKETP